MLTFDEIIKKPQHNLKNALIGELNHMGYRTKTKRGFIYAKGSLPVMLVAHMDTVHKSPVKTICRSEDGRFVMSPEGIGGDDRSGVYMILQIIKKHRCHVLFCEDEETGGYGAREFTKSGIRPEINFIVELDRRGRDDAVFYDCYNSEFTEHVTSFGFVEDMGSFSDISIVAPALGIAAVNISAGYYNEHSKHEYVDMDAVELNIGRVGNLISAKSDKFEYIEDVHYRRMFGGRFYEDEWDFGRYYGETTASGKIMALMPVPDSAYIKLQNGEYAEVKDKNFVDACGKLYEYIYDLDVAVPVEGCEVYSEHGRNVVFKLENAIYVEVVPLDYADEAIYFPHIF